MCKKSILLFTILTLVIIGTVAMAKISKDTTYNITWKYTKNGSTWLPASILGYSSSGIGGASWCGADVVKEYELYPCTLEDVQGVKIEIEKLGTKTYEEFDVAFWDDDIEDWIEESENPEYFDISTGVNLFTSRRYYRTSYVDGTTWDYSYLMFPTYVMSLCYKYKNNNTLYERRYWILCD